MCVRYIILYAKKVIFYEWKASAVFGFFFIFTYRHRISDKSRRKKVKVFFFGKLIDLHEINNIQKTKKPDKNFLLNKKNDWSKCLKVLQNYTRSHNATYHFIKQSKTLWTIAIDSNMQNKTKQNQKLIRME